MTQKLLDTVEGLDGKNTSSRRMMLDCLASGRYGKSSERLERLTDGHPDKMARSSRRLTGNLNSSIFFPVQSLLNMLGYVESLFTVFLHTSVFVQTQNEANKTNKLPLWPFWDKNHLTGLEIHSRSKNKNYSPFLSQRDKG
jgi:hypothetical protein